MSEYVKILQLNKLTAKQKQKILESLYQGKYREDHTTIQVDISIVKPYSLPFEWHTYKNVDVIFNDFSKPDLCVSHFGYNFYFRTQKAINYEKYNTLGQAISALKRLLKQHGFNHSSNLRFYKNNNNCFNLEFDL